MGCSSSAPRDPVADLALSSDPKIVYAAASEINRLARQSGSEMKLVNVPNLVDAVCFRVAQRAAPKPITLVCMEILQNLADDAEGAARVLAFRPDVVPAVLDANARDAAFREGAWAVLSNLAFDGVCYQAMLRSFPYLLPTAVAEITRAPVNASSTGGAVSTLMYGVKTEDGTRALVGLPGLSDALKHALALAAAGTKAANDAMKWVLGAVAAMGDKPELRAVLVANAGLTGELERLADAGPEPHRRGAATALAKLGLREPPPEEKHDVQLVVTAKRMFILRQKDGKLSLMSAHVMDRGTIMMTVMTVPPDQYEMLRGVMHESKRLDPTVEVTDGIQTDALRFAM